jgi:AmmeMemoRadiSam system protein B
MGLTAAKGKIRPTIVDGIFYPAERGKLRDLVQELLSRSPAPEAGCFGVVSPHAGYSYAGEVMASAFRSISLRRVKTAVLIGPIHRDPVRGIFLPESEQFATPLGPLSVDKGAVGKLLGANPIFAASDVPHLEEHCLEVQLPFLAHLFPDLSIVPLLIGEESLKTVEILSRALRLTFESAGDYTVYIASANMASYMRGKGTQNESETLMRMVESRDWRGMSTAGARGGISSCGTAGIAALLSLGGDETRVTRLSVSDSRAVDGDPHRAVHYASFSFELKTG